MGCMYVNHVSEHTGSINLHRWGRILNFSKIDEGTAYEIIYYNR